ncbi:MAG: acyltransferase [Chitinophagaceae bacterium]
MTINSSDLINKPSTKLYGLDHLRALAICFVFMYHYSGMFPSPPWLSSISKFGWTGVDLFFVLSGYLISSQLFASIAAGKTISFKTFFLKRFFRIIPGYLFIVGIYFLIPSSHEREALAPLWKYISFTQNLGLDLRHQGTFSHAWSLCIEEQFYLLLPLLLILLSSRKKIKWGPALFLIFFLGGLLYRLLVYTQVAAPALEADGGWAIWYKWIYYPTPARLDGLLTGVGIAALFCFYPAIKEKLTCRPILFLLAGLLLLVVSYWICTDERSFAASVFGFPLISLGYGLWLIAALSPGSFLYKYRCWPTEKLAMLSYAIYLSHKIVIHLGQILFSKYNIEGASNTMFIACILLSVLAGWLMHLAIEMPFLRLRQRILSNQ